jgi:glycosyltransferase involved in cell wall biosynthesis
MSITDTPRKKLNILLLSHTAMDGPFVVGSHHIYRELSKKGHNVVHVSSPINPVHLVKYKNLRTRLFYAFLFKSEKKNIVPLSLAPWKITKHFLKLWKKNMLLKWMYPTFKQIKKRNEIDQFDLILLDQPKFFGFEKYLPSPGVFYRPTDIYSSMEKDDLITEIEAQILNKARGIIATSKPVLDHLKDINKSLPVTIVENGVDYEHMVMPQPKPSEYKRLKGPILVYVGAMDQRLDKDAFIKIAEVNKEANIVIIGPYNDEVKNQFSPYPNIHLLGKRDYDKIPGYLQHSTIGLLPLSTDSANQGRSPMKLYEYGAAGLPVIATRTKELERRNKKFVFLYDSHEELTQVVDHLLNTDINSEEIAKSVKEYSWENKTNTILEFCKETVR